MLALVELVLQLVGLPQFAVSEVSLRGPPALQLDHVLLVAIAEVTPALKLCEETFPS